MSDMLMQGIRPLLAMSGEALEQALGSGLLELLARQDATRKQQLPVRVVLLSCRMLTTTWLQAWQWYIGLTWHCSQLSSIWHSASRCLLFQAHHRGVQPHRLTYPLWLADKNADVATMLRAWAKVWQAAQEVYRGKCFAPPGTGHLAGTFLRGGLLQQYIRHVDVLPYDDVAALGSVLGHAVASHVHQHEAEVAACM